MRFTHCPDCSTPLSAKSPERCRCGWIQPTAPAAAPGRIPLMPCGRGGCKNEATVKVAGRWICLTCRDDLKSDEARKFCEAKGLRTIDEKRDYCKRMARSFGRGLNFDRWAEAIKQPAVDFFVRDASKGSISALERLREAGVIDGRNQVIPPGEAREIAKAAQRAERARQIAQVQQELEARRAKENAFGEETAT